MLQYEIEYEGRKYFGNVSLKEFHCFDYQGEFYLLDVERMVPYKLSEPAYRGLAEASIYAGGLIPGERMKILRDFQLVAGEDEGPEGPPAGNPGEGESGKGSSKGSDLGVSSIALFVAQECNLSCVYCYGEGGGYGGSGRMSPETAYKAVDWLMKNSKKAEEVNISFFGGEPLLNFPLIQQVIEYAQEAAQKSGKKVTFGLTTNATLLSDEIIAFMSREKINPLVSFDGPPEIQNRQRPFKDGSGSYPIVRANIKKLLKVYPRLASRAIVWGDADPLAIEAGMRKAGLTSCSIGPSSPVILAREPGKTTPVEPDKKALALMIDLRRKEGDDLVRAIKDRGVADNSIAAFLHRLISGQKRYFGCGVGKGMAGISVSGDIYPCHRFVGQEDTRMGNIESYRVEGLNEYHRALVSSLPECRTCWVRSFCGGGCFYDNKARTGDLHRAGRSYCDEIKATVEIAVDVYFRMDEEDRGFLKTAYEDKGDEKLP